MQSAEFSRSVQWDVICTLEINDIIKFTVVEDLDNCLLPSSSRLNSRNIVISYSKYTTYWTCLSRSNIYVAYSHNQEQVTAKLYNLCVLSGRKSVITSFNITSWKEHQCFILNYMESNNQIVVKHIMLCMPTNSNYTINNVPVLVINLTVRIYLC